METLIEKLNEIRKRTIEMRDMHRLSGDASFFTYARMADAIVKEIDEIINELKD